MANNRTRRDDDRSVRRIVSVTQSLNPSLGGPTTAAIALHESFRELGCEAKLLSVGRDPGSENTPLLRSVREVSQADLIIAHGVYSLRLLILCAAAAIFNRPYVLFPHGSLKSIAENHPFLKPIFDLTGSRFMVRNARAVSFCSSLERAQTRQNIGTFRHIITPLGADHVGGRTFVRRGTPAGQFKIVFVGRIAAVKRLDLLIDAIAQGPCDWHLTVVGEDFEGLRAALEAQCSAAKILSRVHFVGGAEPAERDAFLRNSDLLVLPSDSENFGLAAVEGLATGVPVVVSDRVGMLEHCVDRRAVTSFAAGSLPALVSAIEEAQSKVMEDPSETRRVARALASDQFSWSRVATDILNVAC